MPLSIAPDDGEGDAYGKSISELQTGIVVSDGAISGTLHYVENYTNFSSAIDEQEGNYLVVTVEADPDATVKFHLVGGSKGEITLTPDDRQVVCRIRDKNSQSIRITAEKGGKRNVKNYSLTGLTLEAKAG